VPCIAFSQSARQSSLLGKNASGVFCRALGQNAHGKGSAVHIPLFPVRRSEVLLNGIQVTTDVCVLYCHHIWVDESLNVFIFPKAWVFSINHLSSTGAKSILY
jgi:hypothetical protein